MFTIMIVLGLVLGGEACKTGLRSADDLGHINDAAIDLATPDQSHEVDMTLPVRCIDLPMDNSAQPRPSLQDVGMPRILWQKTLPGSGNFHLPLALAGDHLAITDNNALWIVDRGNGSIVGQVVGGPAWGPSASGAVADADGNFYFATSTVFSVKPNGTIRWQKELGPNQAQSMELTSVSGLTLSPEGVLYFAATDGVLYAVRARDGTEVWKRDIHLINAGREAPGGSGGDHALFWADATYDANTGEPSGLPVIEGKPTQGKAIHYGLFVNRYIFDDNYDQFIHGYVLDKCSQVLWALPNHVGSSWYFALVGFDGEFLADGFDHRGDSNLVSIYSKTGTLLRGPMAVKGQPENLGADNAFYTFECRAPDQNLTLRAYSWDSLQMLWSLDLGTGCEPGNNAVLADDGVLYVARGMGSPIEIIAVQTQSPGLADTAMPTWLYNNRRTGWLE